MNDLQHNARLFAHAFLLNKKLTMEISNDVILEVIDTVEASLKSIGNIDKDELFQILVSDFSIGAGAISVLNEKYEPWLDEFKPKIKWDLWHRYSLYMKKQDPSFPILDLDIFTDKILDNCGNPNKLGSWDKRGMVVGHVQSGKTSNFIGLINKATDAGYKVIIILAGTISSLRRQTQERVDEGFVGRSSSNNEQNIIGVGQYSADKSIYPLTTTYYQNGDKGDFNIASANKFNYPIGESPVVFVIKKNSSILTNLIHWLSGNENVKEYNGQLKLMGIPALIIDDEADAASVNTTKDIDKVKTINKLIRTLLNLFDQKTFIGYTATPYANLFINQEYNEELTTKIKNRTFHIGEDLFPRDFIINLKAPKNYIGASKVFGYEDPVTTVSNEPLPIFRTIDDFDPPFFQKINKDNVSNLPNNLPKSLYQAIQSFILVCAIRRLRGQENKHNSMLVHVALYTKWIDRVAFLVNEVLIDYKNKIEGNDVDFISELKTLYISDFIPTTDFVIENLDYIDSSVVHHKWDEVLCEIKSAVSKIKVRAVHSVKTLGNLEYDGIEEIDYNRYKSTGFSVIAVGGSRLSRGITLQGLSVSYYLRTTKMYDSLMQMGRWFGYRPGYIDLCRLFTTNEIFEWFNHIAMATEEMRNDFDEMTITHQRPVDFRLKVRNHPGALTITSLSKMYWSKEITVSLSGINRQTYSLSKDGKTVKNNFKVFNDLIQSIGLPDSNDRKYSSDGRLNYLLYKNQNIEFICDFIDNYKITQPSINNSTISEYIKAQSRTNSIHEWNIGIISNSGKVIQHGPQKIDDDVMEYIIEYNGEKVSIGCNIRTDDNPKNSIVYTIKKNQIDSPRDRVIDLELGTDIKDAKKQRAIERKGLLLIYSLDERGTTFVNCGIPIIGFSLHFPRIENEQMVSYTSNITSDFDELPQIDDDELDN
jgi:hypothetical protein